MKEMVFQDNIKIIANDKAGEDYFKLTLCSPQISSAARPGQFVQIKVSATGMPLLRRPLGVHNVKGDVFEVLCEVVGEGTKTLSKKQPGDSLDIIGPLGNGFDIKSGVKTILVAGGMGVAPLVFLARKMNTRPLILIGARTKAGILCEKEFKKIGCEVEIATDDGSLGLKGKVTDLLKKLLHTQDRQLPVIYACGPRPMLKAISEISLKNKISAQISLEEHMACGIGACLGCVVATKRGMQRVCKEGPVFDAREIIWQEEK